MENGWSLHIVLPDSALASFTTMTVQWLSMVWDKIPMIWDIIDLANYSLDWHDDLTKSEHHGNSNVADTKN